MTHPPTAPIVPDMFLTRRERCVRCFRYRLGAMSWDHLHAGAHGNAIDLALGHCPGRLGDSHPCRQGPVACWPEPVVVDPERRSGRWLVRAVGIRLCALAEGRSNARLSWIRFRTRPRGDVRMALRLPGSAYLFCSGRPAGPFCRGRLGEPDPAIRAAPQRADSRDTLTPIHPACVTLFSNCSGGVGVSGRFDGWAAQSPWPLGSYPGC